MVVVDWVSLQEKRNLLPPSLRIVGFAPDEMAREEFVGMIEQGARTDSPKFAEQLKGFVSVSRAILLNFLTPSLYLFFFC